MSLSRDLFNLIIDFIAVGVMVQDIERRKAPRSISPKECRFEDQSASDAEVDLPY
jgi:hypothetical protein